MAAPTFTLYAPLPSADGVRGGVGASTGISGGGVTTGGGAASDGTDVGRGVIRSDRVKRLMHTFVILEWLR